MTHSGKMMYATVNHFCGKSAIAVTFPVIVWIAANQVITLVLYSCLALIRILETQPTVTLFFEFFCKLSPARFQYSAFSHNMYIVKLG